MSATTRQAIYVIAGGDRYRACALSSELQSRLAGADADLAVSVVDGKDTDAASVFDELNTLPFLSSCRVVVVDHADKFVSENRPMLEKYFASPSPTGTLVLIVDSWPSTTKLAKALPNVGKLLSAEAMKAAQAIKWAGEQAVKLGKSLSPAASQALVELVGTDSGRIANELEKLSLFCAARKTIDVADIEQLSGPTAEQSIFLINDLIADGKTQAAIATLEKILRQDRSAEYSMVGVLSFSLRRLLKGRAMLDAGMREHEVAPACGVRWMPERFLGQLRRFSTSKLERLVSSLAGVDHANKSGLGYAQLNLEKFIVCATGM